MLKLLKSKWKTLLESGKKFSSVTGHRVTSILKISSDTNNSWRDNTSAATFGKESKNPRWSQEKCCWTWCKLWSLQKWQKRICKERRNLLRLIQKKRLKKLKDDYYFWSNTDFLIFFLSISVINRLYLKTLVKW